MGLEWDIALTFIIALIIVIAKEIKNAKEK